MADIGYFPDYESPEFRLDEIRMNSNKQGECKVYFTNGRLNYICFYSNDKREGLYHEYYENQRINR